MISDSFWSLDLLEAIQGFTFQLEMFVSIYSILAYFTMFSFQVLTCLRIISIRIMFQHVQTCLRITWIVTIHIILNLNKFRHVSTCSDFEEFRQMSALNILRIDWYIALGAFYRAILDSILLNDFQTCLNLFRLNINCYDSYNSHTCLNMLKHVYTS